MTKFIPLIIIGLTLLASCKHETLDDRAEQMTREYTERYCPTPVKDMQRTDSVTFTRASRTFNFYYTLTSDADNGQVVSKLKKDLVKELLRQLNSSTGYKVYKEEGFNFHYVFRSEKTGSPLLETTFTKKEYK